MGCWQVYNTEAGTWSVVGNMFGECHAPCMLKTCFVDLKKKSRCIVAATKD